MSDSKNIPIKKLVSQIRTNVNKQLPYIVKLEEVDIIVRDVFEVITNLLKDGNSVNIPGFGKFTTESKVRKAWNYGNGEHEVLWEKHYPRFTFSSKVSERINKTTY